MVGLGVGVTWMNAFGGVGCVSRGGRSGTTTFRYRCQVEWTSPVPAAVNGIIHVPAHNTPIKPGRRDALLIAIAKARKWIGDLADGRAASFAVIARREGKLERQVRLLAPLAFLSPRIVSALLDGTAPAGLTLTALARALPDSWADQERRLAAGLIGHRNDVPNHISRDSLLAP